MTRSQQPDQRFPLRLTQAQRKVVAEIVPELADRLKLDDRLPVTEIEHRE